MERQREVLGRRYKKTNVEPESRPVEDETTPAEPVRRKRKRKTLNRDIRVVTYIFVLMFALLIGNFIYFIAVDSKGVINSSYNKRQDILAETVSRGMILGSDGEILAKSTYDKNGNYTRSYPYKNIFSHVVGRYLRTKTGLEASQGFTMLTSSINPIIKGINEIKGVKSPGDNIVTTLDVNLQKLAYNALGSKKGAVVVMEPKTGKILAMVSKPDYDPNRVNENWDKLISADDDSSALLNRATQGLYPPGSTYKILTALQYIRSNPDTYSSYRYTCNGTHTFGNTVINCHNKKHHGTVDIKKAFAESCNGAFVDMGSKLDLNDFKKLNNSMLFNQAFKLDIAVNKSSYSVNSSTDQGVIYQTMMGQGQTLITPMHNAMIVSAIANDGVVKKPYLVDRVENNDGKVISKTESDDYATLMSKDEAYLMRELMDSVVSEGTATSLRSSAYAAGGKTGSAEFNSKGQSHGWFVGYAGKQKGKPEIVVSIVVEDSGTGSDYAVPIARKIFNSYFR
ncbi:cell division protein FtsI [peptidoglycan synthetase] [Lachnospiraceae bacterium KM106-2]|nr:cell division protein FtsI [peptidoglycan synthetase] [Lachnospiraceae bacterium KM106-2]